MGDSDQADQLYRTASSLGMFGGSLYPVGINYLFAGEYEKGIPLVEQGWADEDPVYATGRDLFLLALEQPEKQAAFETYLGKASASQYYLTVDNLDLLSILGSPYMFTYLADLQCATVNQSIWSETFREQRKTPEFFEMMERAGMVEYWREFGWPDDCASLDQNLAECGP